MTVDTLVASAHRVHREVAGSGFPPFLGVAPRLRASLDVALHPDRAGITPGLGGTFGNKPHAGSRRSPGEVMGNHPSAKRPTRRKAAADAPPIQIGIGRWMGKGAMPAPWM